MNISQNSCLASRFSHRLAPIAIAILLLCSLVPSAARSESRLALVIGNSAYKHTTPLPNPRRDAEAMAATLRRLGFEVIDGFDLDAAAMKHTIRRFAQKLETADVSLFYYAGHGLQVSGKNYLVPVDARLASEIDLEFEAIELQFILHLMDQSAKTSLVFLDACRDNPLAGNLARSMGLQRSVAVGQGLARVESGIGTFVAYATQPGNYAYDGTGRHSPFTEALLEYLETPGLGIEQLMQRVRNSVLRETKGKQVPWDHSSLTGEFYFKNALPPPPRVASRPVPSATTEGGQSQSAELVYWESIRNSKNAADYQAYLTQFPSGIFTALARNRLNELSAKNRPAATLSTQPAERKPSPTRPNTKTPIQSSQGKQLPHGTTDLASSSARTAINFAADREMIKEAIVNFLDMMGGSRACWTDIALSSHYEPCSVDSIQDIEQKNVSDNQLTVVAKFVLVAGAEKRTFSRDFVLLKQRKKIRVLEMHPQ